MSSCDPKYFCFSGKSNRAYTTASATYQDVLVLDYLKLKLLLKVFTLYYRRFFYSAVYYIISYTEEYIGGTFCCAIFVAYSIYLGE
jgi:hypothetical protein